MLVALIAFIFCIAYFIIFAMCKTAKEADNRIYHMYNERKNNNE